jgi:hypothetical protein
MSPDYFLGGPYIAVRRAVFFLAGIFWEWRKQMRALDRGAVNSRQRFRFNCPYLAIRAAVFQFEPATWPQSSRIRPSRLSLVESTFSRVGRPPKSSGNRQNLGTGLQKRVTFFRRFNLPRAASAVESG